MQAMSSLGSAQLARWATIPEQAAAPVPARELLLEMPRERNAFLDGIFYDVGVLSSDEAAQLAPRYAAEGMILSVGPSDRPSIEMWPDELAFSSAGAAPHRVLAVAGVGSSALGSAAFARNVADAVGEPVLAVVSGYGLADLLNEAIGGFFLFGYLNSLRHGFERLDDLTRPAKIETESTADSAVDVVRHSADVRTLHALLAGPQPLEILVGHSKGNLVISEALYELRDEHPERLGERAGQTHVVTVSARIAMPPPLRRVTDVMGSLDGFGLLNSRLSIPTDVRVPMAWHHTNTELPLHLPVTRTLREVLVD